VVAANGHAVTLRRKGQAAGEGQPPAAFAGVIGVEFLVATLAPQIAAESREVGGRLGVSRTEPGRSPSDLLDPRDLCDAVVLSVLYRQYRDMSREVGGSNPDVLAAKALAAKVELDERIARAATSWRSAPAGAGDAIPARFSARISR